MQGVPCCSINDRVTKDINEALRGGQNMPIGVQFISYPNQE